MSPAPTEATAVAERHLRFGWWALAGFLALGLVLESLHGFKAGLYLNVSNETRRLMWTLAHAHGTLFALVNLGFAAAVAARPAWRERPRAAASACLRAGTILMPLGFLLGGVWVHGGDPGVGIVLAPLGGVLMLAAVGLTAVAVSHGAD